MINIVKNASLKNKPLLMDCTLRDGSYEVNFAFDAEFTKILALALESSGIELIEIGHGVGIGASDKGIGQAAVTDKDYFEAASNLSLSSWGAFCIPGIAELDHVTMASEFGMGFIRIGIDIHNIKRIQPYIELARKLGIFTFVNFMKSYVASPKEFYNAAKLAVSYGAEGIYVVDSAGGMLPSELGKYFDALSELSPEVILGFHGHNNLGLAVANSLYALEKGALVVDASLRGLGRSAGNASMEKLIACLVRAGSNIKLNPLDVFKIGDRYISNLIKPNKGCSLDVVSGMAQFHSSYFPLIEKYSNNLQVDPLELILRLCAKDKVNAPEELVEELAIELNLEGNSGSWSERFGHYVLNEQARVF